MDYLEFLILRKTMQDIMDKRERKGQIEHKKLEKKRISESLKLDSIKTIQKVMKKQEIQLLMRHLETIYSMPYPPLEYAGIDGSWDEARHGLRLHIEKLKSIISSRS